MTTGSDVPRSVLEASVRGARVDTDALAAGVDGVTLAQLEASVRWSPSGSARGNRVMIEDASEACVSAVLAALGCGADDAARRLLDAARAHGVPRIAGWDADGERVLAKLYVNASDASESVRAELWRDAAVPALVPNGGVAHLVALNVSPDGAAWKAYVQHEDAALVAAPLGPRAAELAERTREAGLEAGGVTCWEDGGRARAFFVALREADAVRVDAFLASLPGASLAAIDAALPFSRGQCRSVGVALASHAEHTAYFKPAGLGVKLWQLEPTAAFRTVDGEVALFVTPRDAQDRAYARTARHALSYRVRSGRPAMEDVHALMQWATARTELAERDGAEAATALDAPPRPWLRA